MYWPYEAIYAMQCNCHPISRAHNALQEPHAK